MNVELLFIIFISQCDIAKTESSGDVHHEGIVIQVLEWVVFSISVMNEVDWKRSNLKSRRCYSSHAPLTREDIPETLGHLIAPWARPRVRARAVKRVIRMPTLRFRGHIWGQSSGAGRLVLHTVLRASHPSGFRSLVWKWDLYSSFSQQELRFLHLNICTDR